MTEYNYLNEHDKSAMGMADVVGMEDIVGMADVVGMEDIVGMVSMTGASPVTTILCATAWLATQICYIVVTGLAPVMLHTPVMSLVVSNATGKAYI